MKILPGYITKFIASPSGFSFGRKEILLCGMAALGVLLLTLVIWDVYLFYSTLVRSGRRSGSIEQAAGVTARDAEEVIQLLDARKERSDSLRGVLR